MNVKIVFSEQKKDEYLKQLQALQKGETLAFEDEKIGKIIRKPTQMRGLDLQF